MTTRPRHPDLRRGPACCGGGELIRPFRTPPPPNREDPPWLGGCEAATAQTAGTGHGLRTQAAPCLAPAPDRLASDEGVDMRHEVVQDSSQDPTAPGVTWACPLSGEVWE